MSVGALHYASFGSLDPGIEWDPNTCGPGMGPCWDLGARGGGGGGVGGGGGGGLALLVLHGPEPAVARSGKQLAGW